MKKILAILITAVVGAVYCAVVLAVVLVGYFVWQLHPWVPTGQSFALGNWKFGEYEFQAWQRKNAEIFEPFADGLFVRRGTNEWQAYRFDIQDSYSPRVRLQKQDSQIMVYRDGENRGVFDMETETFKRHGQVYTPMGIGNSPSPPGKWWLK